eukprot:5793076-Amphidinium_carterae.1
MEKIVVMMAMGHIQANVRGLVLLAGVRGRAETSVADPGGRSNLEIVALGSRTARNINRICLGSARKVGINQTESQRTMLNKLPLT